MRPLGVASGFNSTVHPVRNLEFLTGFKVEIHPVRNQRFLTGFIEDELTEIEDFRKLRSH